MSIKFCYLPEACIVVTLSTKACHHVNSNSCKTMLSSAQHNRQIITLIKLPTGIYIPIIYHLGSCILYISEEVNQPLLIGIHDCLHICKTAKMHLQYTHYNTRVSKWCELSFQIMITGGKYW